MTTTASGVYGELVSSSSCSSNLSLAASGRMAMDSRLPGAAIDPRYTELRLRFGVLSLVLSVRELLVLENKTDTGR